MTVFESRLAKLKNKLQENDIDTAIITDEDNVYYLCGYYDYLHMEFGRPTLLVISIDYGTLLITPTINLNTAEETACVDRISAWNDGMGNEWREELPKVLKRSKRIAIEPDQMPPIVRRYIDVEVSSERITFTTYTWKSNNARSKNGKKRNRKSENESWPKQRNRNDERKPSEKQ